MGRSHQEPVTLGFREVARRLNAALGETLVSTLAGANNISASREWAKDGGRQPDPANVRRLELAYVQWQRVAKAEGEHIARAWFIGGNSWLGDDTPVTAIREDRFEQVNHAAQALIDDSFSG